MSKSEISLLRSDQECLVNLSVYGLTNKGIELNIERIRRVYPSLSAGFYRELVLRLIKKKFSDDKFSRAIDNVFDTCRFTPTLADFISYEPNEPLPEKTQGKEERVLSESELKKEKEIEDFNEWLLNTPDDEIV